MPYVIGIASILGLAWAYDQGYLDGLIKPGASAQGTDAETAKGRLAKHYNLAVTDQFKSARYTLGELQQLAATLFAHGMVKEAGAINELAIKRRGECADFAARNPQTARSNGFRRVCDGAAGRFANGAVPAVPKV